MFWSFGLRVFEGGRLGLLGFEMFHVSGFLLAGFGLGFRGLGLEVSRL